ncbi:MAG TPA: hypothetical protein PLD88_12315, partial [Candidatus Berkiella sp.]|nr:hypothetical protein [Candidatus Berkiella sp.]
MMDFLAQYGLFLAKTLTFVIAILITLAGIAGILARNKKGSDGSITIENVNEKMTDIRDSLQLETLPKHAISQWKK